MTNDATDTTTRTPAELAATYFESWRTRDFDTLRSILADDVTFRGPLGQEDDADDCRRSLEGLRQALEDIVVHVIATDGPDAITWFDLHFAGGAVVPVANWSHVEDGKIARIRVTFDPRPIL